MKTPTPGQSLTYLVLAGIGLSGWLYGLHWKRIAFQAGKKAAPAAAPPLPEPLNPAGPETETVVSTEFTPMERHMIQLQDQVAILTEQNESLLKQLREKESDEAPDGGVTDKN